MYSRETELRHLRPNDTYKLAVILDDNQCWKKLMEVIPKDLNSINSSGSKSNSTSTEEVMSGMTPKYNNDHVRLIECAVQRPGESRLYSQILFDEWGTSGRKHDRPTLGVLLLLLVRAELFRAADFVAMHFLNEPPPPRPLSGPAAHVDISLTDEIFADIEDIVNDSSYYPATASLIHNANYVNSSSFIDNNKDYCTKYHINDKQIVSSGVVIDQQIVQPKLPPRTSRSTVTIRQHDAFVRASGSTNEWDNNINVTRMAPSANIPKFSMLTSMNSNNVLVQENEAGADVLPNCRCSCGNSSCSCCRYNYTTNECHHQMQIQNTETTNVSESPIPIISILAQHATSTSNQQTTISNEHCKTNTNLTSTNSSKSLTNNDTEILPIISALNIEGIVNREDNTASNTTAMATTTTSKRQTHKEIAFAYDYGSDDVEGNDSASGGNADHSRSSSISYDSSDNENAEECINHPGDQSCNENDNCDENDLPNLSALERRSSNNDSSLTTVTDNSFDLNDCSSNSENIPYLSALKQ